MLSEAAIARMGETESSSYVCDVKKWHAIMQAYENGGHAYSRDHANRRVGGVP